MGGCQRKQPSANDLINMSDDTPVNCRVHAVVGVAACPLMTRGHMDVAECSDLDTRSQDNQETNVTYIILVHLKHIDN